MIKLFNVYVKDLRNWLESIEDYFGNTYTKVSQLDRVIQESEIGDEDKKLSQEVLISVSNLYKKFVTKLEDLKNIDEDNVREARKLRKENTELVEQNKQLISLLEQYRVSIQESTSVQNERMKDIIQINNIDNTDIQESTSVEVLELKESVDKVLELFESNLKVILTSEKMKQSKYIDKDRTGENNYHFRADVANEELIQDYLNGMGTTQLAAKYKMGANGIRERLKRANVWKGRQ